MRVFTDRAELFPISIGMYGGTLQISSRVDRSTEPPRFTANVQMRNLDVAEVLAVTPSARGKMGGQRHFQIHGDGEWAAEVDGIGGVFVRVRQADGEERDADFGFLAGPVQVICLGEIEIEFEGFFGVGGIARFHVGDFALDAIERGDGLAELFPLGFGRAAAGDAQGELVIATEKIAQRAG